MNTNTLLLNKGYKPELSEGSIITPVFRSSTFCFPSAEDGEKAFRIMQGKIESDEDPSLVYSRMNNPNMEITEEKIAFLEEGVKEIAESSLPKTPLPERTERKPPVPYTPIPIPDDPSLAPLFEEKDFTL